MKGGQRQFADTGASIVKMLGIGTSSNATARALSVLGVNCLAKGAREISEVE